MPQLKILDGAVDTILLPSSGITVQMRKVATGRDKAEAWASCAREGKDPKQNRARFMCHVAAALIVSWDATRPDEDGDAEPVPISADVLGAMEDQGDYITIVAAAAERMTLREDDAEKERPFGTFSTPSSPATSSKTKKTSRTSSRTSS